jgi:hypothetical protein
LSAENDVRDALLSAVDLRDISALEAAIADADELNFPDNDVDYIAACDVLTRLKSRKTGKGGNAAAAAAAAAESAHVLSPGAPVPGSAPPPPPPSSSSSSASSSSSLTLSSIDENSSTSSTAASASELSALSPPATDRQASVLARLDAAAEV